MVEVRDVSYYYERFQKEYRPSPNLFERIAFFAWKLLPLPFSWKKYDETMKALGWQLRSKHALALAVLTTVLSLPVAFYLFAYAGGGTIGLLAFFVILAVAFVVPFFGPLYYAEVEKMNFLGQAPMALLYMAIAMEITPNLESSVEFAAKNMPDPIGRAFKRLLWEVETRKKVDMVEALSDYAKEIAPWAPHVAEALYLIASSTREMGARRREVLEKALHVALTGTRRYMEKFARGLSLPVMATNAFGIMLPVLFLVLGPVAAAFMHGFALGPTLVVLYNVILPLVLLAIILGIATKRPGIISSVKFKRVTSKVNLFGIKVPIVLVPLAVLIPGFLWQMAIISKDPQVLLSRVPSMGEPASVLTTLPAVAAVAFAIAIGLKLWVGKNREVKRNIENIEREFPSVLYQLGHILEEGIPLEDAIGYLQGRLKGMTTEVFFEEALRKMRLLGLSIEDVFLDEKKGIINKFPSDLIRNIMMVLIKASKKGPKSTAMTALNISRYLAEMQKVKEKIEDLLSESIVSMKFQGKFLIPMITGIVVGMGELVVKLLLGIGKQITTLMGGGVGYGASFLLDFFNVRNLIQPSFLQLTIGLYLILTLLIIGLFVGILEEGFSSIAIADNIADLLFTALPIYILSLMVISVGFGAMLTQALGGI